MKKCNTCGREYPEVNKEKILADTEIGTWFACDCGATILKASAKTKVILRKAKPYEKPDKNSLT